MKIVDIRCFEVTGRGEGPWPAVECRLVRPLDVYDEFRAEGADDLGRRSDAARDFRHAFLEITTDDGPAGLFGPIDRRQAFLVRTWLRPFLCGRDPMATERLWDQMARLDRHGRTGYAMMAISAVDCALWDLRGKALGLPVWRLLGGPTREAVPAYASMLGFSQREAVLEERAQEFQQRGFAGQKWFFRFGPGSGPEGLQSNVALVRRLRAALGDEADLMFDAWTSWDLPYALRMARAIEPARPAWLEEPLPPDRLDGYRRLKRETAVPLATGEHLYTRWGVKPLLDAGAVDVLQTDPDWTGGITELVKICALAAEHGVPVVPHGHGIAAALHVAASQPPGVCPMVEYLVQHMQNQQFFSKAPLEPEGGMIALPEAPGLGIELDEAKVESRRDLAWD